VTTPHHRLSKSRYTYGLQCVRQLWWRVHEPHAPELVPDATTQAVLDQGTHVGVVARGHIPGGTLIDLPHRDYEARVAATTLAMREGASAVYEASFTADDLFVAVDVLERTNGGWRIVEVKSSTSVRGQHLPDAAIQTHVLRAAGVPVTGTDIMVLNRACTYPDLSDLFRREDVSAPVAHLLPGVPARVRTLLAAIEGPLPAVATGPQCTSPYRCPFHARCNPVPPPHHVSTLYRMRRHAAELEAQGWHTIEQVPPGVLTIPQAERQRRAVIAGAMVVEGDLAGSLAAFEPPLAYLDFETVMPAIPCWDGCHPYDQVPAQFSVHAERPDGTLAHHAWLADGPGDPRPEIARRVIEACAGARTIVVYNREFEQGCLERMAAALPEHAAALYDLVGRLADPLHAIRDHVYHPDFNGSFSLKAVLPALVPGLSYDDLDVAIGHVATRMIEALMFGGDVMPADERARRRAALLAYCERDTLAMVRLMARLRELAAGA